MPSRAPITALPSKSTIIGRALCQGHDVALAYALIFALVQQLVHQEEAKPPGLPIIQDCVNVGPLRIRRIEAGAVVHDHDPRIVLHSHDDLDPKGLVVVKAEVDRVRQDLRDREIDCLSKLRREVARLLEGVDLRCAADDFPHLIDDRDLRGWGVQHPAAAPALQELEGRFGVSVIYWLTSICGRRDADAG